ncbi:MAG: MBL fold metallo-hydrolase [Candidatus Kuenenia sp.]|nr:MBL fold metallo-hydrolase [Candidatus Kuenenia hertensis]
MELTIIGSGTGVPSKTRAYPCTLIKIKNKYLVFDTGPGSLRQLFLAGVTYTDIDYIYYSHFHPDHSLDLVSFLFAMKYDTPERTKPLYVTGPRGLHEFHQGLLSVYGNTIRPKSFDLHRKEIERGKLTYDGWEISVEPMQHSSQSIGFRIGTPEGNSITYSGDTDYCDGIIHLAKNTDLLVLECSFPDDKKAEGHLTPRLCAQIAQKAQCKKLILTHFYPMCSEEIKNNKSLLAELKTIYNGTIVFAEDFDRFEI